MGLNNVSLKTKLMGAVLFSLVFMVSIVIINQLGLGWIKESQEKIARLNKLDQLMLNKEIDHFKWSVVLQEAIMDDEINTINVEMDDHKCGLGSWLYGPDRRKLESTIPELSRIIKNLEKPHYNLHQSAISLGKALNSGTFTVDQLNDLYQTTSNLQLSEVRNGLKNIRNILSSQLNQAHSEMIEIEESVNFYTWVTILSGLILMTLMGYFVGVSILKPMRRSMEFAHAIEQGDLSVTMEVNYQDEFGELLRAQNRMVENLRSIIGNLIKQSNSLNVTAITMNEVSGKLSEGSGSVAEKVSSVSSAAEEMSVTMAAVSTASEQATENINNVSSSTEEMNSTVSEIASNTAQASSITTRAVASVKEASEKVNALGDAAQKINMVIEIINDISEQTKLLALNATIEAARAGEAGKGFAVVANEVKELAKQTNDAIEDIRGSVEAIQNSAKITVLEIGSIQGIINEVDQIVTTIATAVEEQSVTTRDMSLNLHQAATGIGEMNNSVAQSAQASQAIAQDIEVVNRNSSYVQNDSQIINENAGSLANMSVSLKEIVDKFKLN